MPTNPVTLRQVADHAGVSVMTASRALRHLPNVNPATRAQVAAAAEALGYEADPHLNRLMSRVRSKRRRSVTATIAVLREDPPRENLTEKPYQFVPLDWIREAALVHGYSVDEFWLGRDGLTPDKARRVLRARGIEGVIVSPQSEELPCSQFDYTGFAAAAFGFAMREPALHTAATNMHLGTRQLAEAMRRKGYRRFGIAITEWLDHRVQNGYRSGLHLHHLDVPESDRVPLLCLSAKTFSRQFTRFREWYEQYSPDIIVSFSERVPEWIEERLGLRIPEDIGFIVHDRAQVTDPRFAGVDHVRREIAQSAVNLVVNQLQCFESGVPERPRQILISPRWIDGDSIRKDSGAGSTDVVSTSKSLRR